MHWGMRVLWRLFESYMPDNGGGGGYLPSPRYLGIPEPPSVPYIPGFLFRMLWLCEGSKGPHMMGPRERIRGVLGGE